MAAPFDAPRTLETKPDAAPSDADRQNPDVARYPAVFAEAVATAAKLHAALLSDAARAADAARSAASLRADGVQAVLDDGLERLADSLAGARVRLALRADTALLLLAERAASAKAEIDAAARDAKSKLAAEGGKLAGDFKVQHDAGLKIEKDARGKKDGILADGARSRPGRDRAGRGSRQGLPGQRRRHGDRQDRGGGERPAQPDSGGRQILRRSGRRAGCLPRKADRRFQAAARWRHA